MNGYRNKTVAILIATLILPTSAVAATIAVDQSPLLMSSTVAPNIVLMLDDSGSMAEDQLPDNLKDSSDDGFRDSLVNELYYDPTVVYQAPPKADSTPSAPDYYPNASFPNAWVDGFTQATLTDLGSYMGYSGTTPYFVGTSSNGSGGGWGNWGWWGNWGGWGGWGGQQAATSGVFTYDTGPVGGPYAQHYVSTNCAALPAAFQSNCDDSAAVRQNVANWFSYYHTRILMAKSGLMGAFSQLNSSFRVGFGSINGSGSPWISSNITDTYALPGLSYSIGWNQTASDYLAEVKAFGGGATGTRKNDLWNWLLQEQPSGYTPLRAALNAVGRYYQTTQPWTDTSLSATDNACRQSYTILTTDGYWNGSFSGIGNVDNKAGPTIKNPSKTNSYSYNPAAPFSDNNSDYLADVAMYYWNHDLQGTMDNIVPTNPSDPAFWQHMTTFTLGLGVEPSGMTPSSATASQIQDWANGTGAAIKNFDWGQDQIADLMHAGINGHGGYFSVRSYQQFASAMNSTLNTIQSRLGSSSHLAVNSTSLKSGSTTFEATYQTQTWTGDLLAYAIDPATGLIAATPTWAASGQLPTPASRNIWTYNPTTGGFVAFQVSNLSTTELSALGSTTQSQSDIVDWLRGSNQYTVSNHGPYRDRTTPLGDIVDSSPVYVGSSDSTLYSNDSFTGSSDYPAFAGKTTTREPMVYIASNDGMLHGFDASTGKEVFAYLPAAVILGGIKNLASPNYGGSIKHQFFNDGSLTVADAYLGGAWKTILVGTTGRGMAKAIYALDITDPSSIKPLWERSAADGGVGSSAIGQTTGQPVVVQDRNSQWAVLIGNGYNSQDDKAELLQISLTDGTIQARPTAGSAIGNGMAQPATISLPNDGLQDTAYAGDLNGNVWAFNLGDSSSGSRVFTATDASGKAQPVTSKMVSAMDTSTGNVWLFFGTGRWLNGKDLSDTSVQSWYGIIAGSKDANLTTNLSTQGRKALVKRTIVYQQSPTSAQMGMRAISKAVTGDMSGKSGWYIDLEYQGTANGERMVFPNQFKSGELIGSTLIPSGGGGCNPTGSGWIMAVDPMTGGNVSNPFFDANGDGKVDSGDTVTVGKDVYPVTGLGFSSMPNNPAFVGNTMLSSFNDASTRSVNVAGSGGGSGLFQRVSWREVIR